MNDFLQQFLIESRELVTEATEGLLLLEQSPADADLLDSVFRGFHTLKGGAGIVEFTAMERAVHAAEDRLALTRSGKQPLDAAVVGDCLACLDQVTEWLDALERTGKLPSVEGEKPGKNADSAEPLSTDWVADLLERNAELRAAAHISIRYTPDRDCFFQGEDPVALMASLPGLLALELAPASPWPPLSQLDPYSCNLVLKALSSASSSDAGTHLRDHSGDCEILDLGATPTAVSAKVAALPVNARKVLEEQLAVLDAEKELPLAGRDASVARTAANVLRFCGRVEQAEDMLRAAEAGTAELRQAIVTLLAPPVVAPDGTARTLRIDAGRVDRLVRLTGELTVAKNAIAHTAKLALDNGDSVASLLKQQHAALDRLIGELQVSAIGMRVLPLRTVFQRFPRVLREMAASLGKSVKLELEGEQTEADKTIVEMLFEPLLHIVRNAIDHGVEDVEERRKQGKPAMATIRLSAERQGDEVLIKVSDDGAGVNVERVRDVALRRGLVTEAELRAMSATDAVELIFAPGFSTAAHVSEISGRGVGMDAVRTAVEKIGGRVAISSRAAQGTTISVFLPFSVMMSQVMTVEAGGQVFGIPLDAVIETVRVARNGISGIAGARAIVHRNRTVPLVELGSVLDASGKKTSFQDSEATVVIAALAGQWVGIQVDHIGERLEVILKSLDGLLSGLPGIAGTTLLGDGRVLLVLDIEEMLQ